MNGRFRNAIGTIGTRARNVAREATTNRGDGIGGRARRAFAAARGKATLYPSK